MSRGLLKAAAYAVAGLVAAVGTASASGLERGGYNIDLLFDPGPFVFDSGVTYVSPQRKLKNVRDTDPRGSNGIGGGATSVDESNDYIIPYFGAKMNVVGPIDCLFDYSQPWGAHTSPGANWAGANSNVETEVKSDNFGATCSYRFDVGRGNLRVIGGGFWQDVYGFKDRLVVGGAQAFGGNGIGHLELNGDGYGWRAGLAYEIPEIAFRASLVYNSEVKLNDITGTLDLSQVPTAILDYAHAPANDPRRLIFGRTTAVFGSAIMPQTVDLKVQTGIAPDWLAYGSVEWVDWSVLQNIPFCPEFTRGLAACTYDGPTRVTSLDLYYQDGWTISGGIGHKFTDHLSGALGITWDRGVSQGYGDLTDTWTVNGGVSFTPNQRVSFIVGGAAGFMTSGSSTAL
ncbi:MAG: OmpP1/FadL family transporter, partial [Pararhizobium sp.]